MSTRSDTATRRAERDAIRSRISEDEQEETIHPLLADKQYTEWEQSQRNKKRQWAQRVIQNMYKKYSLDFEFIWYWLRWYLIALAAQRLPEFATAGIRDIYALFWRLSEHEQDRISEFHLQLAHGERSIANKWKDDGTPIYHWLNRAFKFEWANLKRGHRIEAAKRTTIVDDPSELNGNALTAETAYRISADVLSAAEQEQGIFRGRFGERIELQSGFAQFSDGVSAIYREGETPWSAMGKPLWDALRRFQLESPLHSAIAKLIVADGDVNYSEIARRLNADGFVVSHDKVRRIVTTLRGELEVIRKSPESRRSASGEFRGVPKSQNRAARLAEQTV